MIGSELRNDYAISHGLRLRGTFKHEQTFIALGGKNGGAHQTGDDSMGGRLPRGV